MDENRTAHGPREHPDDKLREFACEGPLIRLVEACAAPCRFALCVGSSREFGLPEPGIPPHLTSASPSRLASYSAGRWSAARALKRLGLHAAPPGFCSETQLPQWPQGVLGSITHTRLPARGCPRQGQIVAGALVWRPEEALAPEGYTLTFGLDAEGIMSSDRARRLGPRLGVALATGLPDALDEGTRATLVFSLKEAAFKATSLGTGLSCGLGDLTIERGEGDWAHLVEGAHQRELNMTLAGAVALRFAGTHASLNAWARLRAWYWVHEDVVWTAAALAQRSCCREFSHAGTGYQRPR